MTENEWNLKKQNAQLRMELMKSQSALAERLFNEAKSEFEALGDKWTAPDNVVELKAADS